MCAARSPGDVFHEEIRGVFGGTLKGSTRLERRVWTQEGETQHPAASQNAGLLKPL